MYLLNQKSSISNHEGLIAQAMRTRNVQDLIIIRIWMKKYGILNVIFDIPWIVVLNRALQLAPVHLARLVLLRPHPARRQEVKPVVLTPL